MEKWQEALNNWAKWTRMEDAFSTLLEAISSLKAELKL